MVLKIAARQAGANVIALDIDKKCLQFCRDTLKLENILNALDENIAKQLDITGGYAYSSDKCVSFIEKILIIPGGGG